MADLKNALSFLKCPKCHEDRLQFKNPYFVCSPCDIKFPCLENILYLVPEPDSFLFQWKIRAEFYQSMIQLQLAGLEKDIQDTSLLESTKERLLKIKQALKLNLETVLKLMSSACNFNSATGLQNSNPTTNAKTINQIRVAKNQHIESYFLNIFRDWVWGNDETKYMRDKVIHSIQDHPHDSVAIMGSGAGRLSEDLAAIWPQSFLFSLDINVFFLHLHQQLAEGKNVTLAEIPNVPLDVDHVAKAYELKSPFKPSQSNHFRIAANAINPPFKKDSLDVIICPWFIDIIPEDSFSLIKRYNRILKTGGLLTIHGLLGYSKPNEKKSYLFSELVDLAKRAGYEIMDSSEDWIPYLQSPHSTQRRSEKCYTFTFKKIKDVEVISDFMPLPDWITDTNLPIPNSDSFASLFSQGKIQTEILSLVNGKNSILQIAEILHTHYQIPKKEAELAIINILSNVLLN